MVEYIQRSYPYLSESNTMLSYYCIEQCFVVNALSQQYIEMLILMVHNPTILQWDIRPLQVHAIPSVLCEVSTKSI